MRLRTRIWMGTAAAALLSCFAAAQSDTSFTYQGELTENGQPAEGEYEMAFSLWDDLSSGGLVGGPLVLDGVRVTGGRFSAELDFGAAAFDNGSRWLEVRVGGFTLEPRTRVSRSPYALQTRGIFVSEDLKVGIGTDSPEEPLHVFDGSAGDVTPHVRSTAVFERSGSNYLSILSPDNTERGLLFGDPESFVNGAILFNSVSTQDGFQFRTGGNQTRMTIDAEGDVVALGRLGVGDPSSLFGQLTVVSDPTDSIFAINADSADDIFPTAFLSNSGSGPAIWAWSSDDASLSGGGGIVVGDEGGTNVAIDRNEIMARNGGGTSTLYLNADGGEVSMGEHHIHPAFAYGLVAQSGAIQSASSNVTSVQRTSTGNYRVYVEGNPRPGDILLATNAEGAAAVGARVDGTRYLVYLRGNSTGDPIDLAFQFVIYRP